MANKQSILVIDDEKDILKLLEYNLQKEGYQVLLSKTGEEGLELAKNRKPDLVILDLMLPGMDGLEVCKLLRNQKSTSHIPILMLTAKSTETDQVVGLEIGASDYITKPFGVKILLARIRNIFRGGTAKKDTGDNVIKVGDFMIDKERFAFTVRGKPVPLTKLEFQIMSFLMEHKGIVFSRDKLLNSAWGGEVFVVDRTVDVHIRSIREKLGKHRDCIETVRGAGYRFREEDA